MPETRIKSADDFQKALDAAMKAPVLVHDAQGRPFIVMSSETYGDLLDQVQDVTEIDGNGNPTGDENSPGD